MQATRPRLRGVATITDRPARIGKLKIGEKTTSKNGKEIPTKLDYIKAVDAAGNIIEAFHEVFGEKPTEFRAVFPSNDPDDFYWEAYRRYGSGTGLVCHGDGRQAIVEETGETIECPCPYAEPTIKDGKEYPPACKPVASLSLFVFDVPALGVFQIDTGSINSIKNIRWFVHSLPMLTGGQYAGIPFKVKVEPFQALHDGKASTAYQWKLDLLPGYKPADLRMAAAQAVDAFLLPPEITGRPMLDEAKPEELYVEPESEPESKPGPEPTSEIGIPGEVVEADLAYNAALKASGLPPAKVEAAKAVRDANRDRAEETANWTGYLAWLEAQTKRIPRAES